MVEGDTNCYLYGVTSGGEPERVAGLAGIDGSLTEAIVQDDLVAAVSRVNGVARSWGIGPDGEVDLESLAPRLLQHEAVLEALLDQGTVLPMRFGVVYPSMAALRDLLAQHASSLKTALSRVRDSAEWGLTVSWARDLASKLLPAESVPEAAATPGRSYLLKRRTERELAGRLDDIRQDTATELHRALQGAATASVTHPLKEGRLTEGQPAARPRPAEPQNDELILKASYLVRNDGAQAFREAVVAGLANGSDVGLRGELTGPWPPYNFAGVTLEGVPA